jgi:hypothetical protein
VPNILSELQQRIATATADLTVAEKELEAVLEAIATTDRADKRIIGPALQAAFTKVVAAKNTLAAMLEDR